MRKARIFLYGIEAGILIEKEKNRDYIFIYNSNYTGEPVSLTMPVVDKEFRFDNFPSFFDGLLPEGVQLDGLLRNRKIDKDDYFEQLITTGSDLVGAVTVEAIHE